MALRFADYRRPMQRNVKTPLLGALACVAGFAALAYALYDLRPVKSLDLRIFLHFTGEESPLVAPADVLIHLGDLGPLLAMTAAVVLLGLHFGRRRETIGALVVIVGANLTTQLLKVLLENPRYPAPDGVSHQAWADLLPSADAFPSGHTTAVASVAVALLLVAPARYRMSAAIAGLLLTAAEAGSVVVMTWHYPSDALGAVLVAATWGLLAVAALHLQISRRHETDQEGSPVELHRSRVRRSRTATSAARDRSCRCRAGARAGPRR